MPGTPGIPILIFISTGVCKKILSRSIPATAFLLLG